MTSVLTVPELAYELGIGRNAAYELLARGELYSVKVGRSIRIPRASLEAWLTGSNKTKVVGAITSPTTSTVGTREADGGISTATSAT